METPIYPEYPNTKLVRVYHSPNYIRIYPVFNPGAYIRKCSEEGKKAEYIGQTDHNGRLIQ